MPEVVFWHRMVSPHMAGLARALAAQGVRVTYVAECMVSSDRAQLGWAAPRMPGVRLEILQGRALLHERVNAFPIDTVHFTQGVRRNGYVREVVNALRRSRRRWGAVLETVNDSGLRGFLKRLDYSWELGRDTARPDFVLAIGARMRRWVEDRGVPSHRVFPFAYFLDEVAEPVAAAKLTDCFRFGFVGRLINIKRVDLLLRSFASLKTSAAELVIIGGGPLQAALRRLGDSTPACSRIRWLGLLPMTEARHHIATLDCLVLPSEHDGWGAVVSESLMAGVPAICSDACGAAVTVNASGVGGVFRSGDVSKLISVMEQAVASGPSDRNSRRSLAEWARCLSAEAGATYLRSIIDTVYQGSERPLAPWTRCRRASGQ